MESLTGEGIALRPFRDADIPQFVAAVRESAATLEAWMPWWKENYSADDAREFFARCTAAIEAKTAFDIGVFLPDNTTFIGGIAINQIDSDNKIGNIGYWVRESLQNQGYCTRATTRIVRFGFDTLKLVRLEIVILADNSASRRVAEKSGALLECVAANRLLHNGLPMPAAVYSLVP